MGQTDAQNPILPKPPHKSQICARGLWLMPGRGLAIIDLVSMAAQPDSDVDVSYIWCVSALSVGGNPQSLEIVSDSVISAIGKLKSDGRFFGQALLSWCQDKWIQSSPAIREAIVTDWQTHVKEWQSKLEKEGE
jgi:hypothetical protein